MLHVSPFRDGAQETIEKESVSGISRVLMVIIGQASLPVHTASNMLPTGRHGLALVRGLGCVN